MALRGSEAPVREFTIKLELKVLITSDDWVSQDMLEDCVDANSVATQVAHSLQNPAECGGPIDEDENWYLADIVEVGPIYE